MLCFQLFADSSRAFIKMLFRTNRLLNLTIKQTLDLRMCVLSPIVGGRYSINSALQDRNADLCSTKTEL